MSLQSIDTVTAGELPAYVLEFVLSAIRASVNTDAEAIDAVMVDGVPCFMDLHTHSGAWVATVHSVLDLQAVAEELKALAPQSWLTVESTYNRLQAAIYLGHYRNYRENHAEL